MVRSRRIWVTRGLWAVTDQGLFALSNFAVSVLLARWLPPRDYGTFSVAFSVLLLMGAVHTALLGEPMQVLGPAHYRTRLAGYLRRLTPLHFVVTSAMGVILLVVVAVLTVVDTPFPSGRTLAALAVSAPGILFLWLMRRACYVESRPRLAAAGGLAYALVIPAGMWSLARMGSLTAASAFLVLGLSSLLVAVALRHRLVRSAPVTTDITTGDITGAHWKYGRWALGSGLLSWVPANVVVVVLPLWHSLEDAGTLRVATTLMLPVQHVQAALVALILPALVRARFSGELRAAALAVGAFFLGLSAAYAPLIIIFGSQVAHLLFGAEYTIDGASLWLLGAIPMVGAVSTTAGAVLRAVERPDRVLWTYVAASVVTGLVGLPLVYLGDVPGALGSVLLATATTAVLGAYMTQRLVASEED